MGDAEGVVPVGLQDLDRVERDQAQVDHHARQRLAEARPACAHPPRIVNPNIFLMLMQQNLSSF